MAYANKQLTVSGKKGLQIFFSFLNMNNDDKLLFSSKSPPTSKELVHFNLESFVSK
jgi:hypothetical protein